MNKKLGLFAVASLIALVSTPSMAQFAKAEDAVKYRGSAMALMGSHFGRMAPVAKKEAPYDKQKIQENVAVLNVLASLPWTAYGPGMAGGESKSEVWSDTDGFKQAQDKFKTGLRKTDGSFGCRRLRRISSCIWRSRPRAVSPVTTRTVKRNRHMMEDLPKVAGSSWFSGAF